MPRKVSFALVGVLGLLGALVAGPSAAAADLTWEPCPASVPLQCAKVPVPLDYDDPDGTQIEIMISRQPSADPAKRRGILMLNPGGPGGTGLDQPAFLTQRGLPSSVLDAYDLIGMDTRGVGNSAPVNCGFTTTDAYRANIPPYARDDAAVDRWAEVSKEIAERCAANDSDGRLRHLTTENMARDLDRIRAALGETKASFYGASYGSALGAAYASLFPDTADRVVVDSIVGDTHLDRSGLRRYALGFEQTFPDFAKWVAARHDAYALGRTPAEVRRTFLTLADKLDTTPPADGADGSLFRTFTLTGMYNEVAYAKTAQVWQSYLNAPEAPAPPPPAEAPNPADNGLTVYLAVTCNDVDWDEDVATYQRAARVDRAKYPLFGGSGGNIMPCAFWKHESEGPVEINDDGPTNVLILQNRHDPVTPLAGAKLLREKFADRSRLVTANGSGHGVYVTGGNACALNVATTYLVDGTMPARDTTCRN